MPPYRAKFPSSQLMFSVYVEFRIVRMDLHLFWNLQFPPKNNTSRWLSLAIDVSGVFLPSWDRLRILGYPDQDNVLTEDK